MRSKNYGINVRVTEQEKQKLLENARFCSLPLSEYLRRLGLGKEVRAAIRERDYRLFRMLNGLKAELPQLQKEEIISRLEAILNELKQARITPYGVPEKSFGLFGERRNSGASEFCRLRRNEGYGACDDEASRLFVLLKSKQCPCRRCLRHLSEQCVFTPGRAGA